MSKNAKLYYTYLDECKRNYLTETMKQHNSQSLHEYSITSITFEKDYYQEKLEPKWESFRKKYDINGKKAIHFADYRKLINPNMQIESDSKYSMFLDNGEFSNELLKDFFRDIKEILEEANFFLVHNNYFWEGNKFLVKRKKMELFEFSKEKGNIAPLMLNNVSYLGMRKHLDMLMQCLLKRKVENDENVDNGYYFDEKLPKKINTKLRFDADGKQFDERTDLKKAYIHTVAMGSDTVNANTTAEILDEIRFIRKEEVGHKYTPNHCGLEIVDLLCSMIAGETRAEKYIEQNIIDKTESDFKPGSFINLKFSDGEEIKFDFILDRILSSDTIKLLY